MHNKFIDVFTLTIALANVSVTNIMDISFFEASHAWNKIAHEHSSAELFFVARGTCVLENQKEIFLFEQGDIFVVPATCAHRLVSTSENARIHTIRAALTRGPAPCGAACDLYGPLHGFFNVRNGVAVLHDCGDIIARADEVRAELYWKTLGFREMADAYFQELYVDIVRKLKHIKSAGDLNGGAFEIDTALLWPESRSDLDETLLNYYFFRQYMEDFTIEKLSGILHLSVSQTHRLVKRIYGISFAQKLIQTRVNAAQDFLAESDLPVEEIARKVGYKSYMGFFSVFKKYTGATPTEYRLRHFYDGKTEGEF